MSDEVVRLDQAPLFELLTVATMFVVAIAGMVIAYQAYRGYQRQDSQAMLYLAIGLTFLTVVPLLVNLLLNSTVGPDQTVTIFLENVSRLLGLVAMAYSLYGSH